jgi:hypothetical protein
MSACSGDIGDDGDAPDGGEGANSSVGEFQPAAPTVHRLTQPQLQNAWLDLFGEPLAIPSELPKDDLAYGFSSIAAASRSISSLEAEQYETATYAILDQIWGDAARRDALVGCTFADLSDPCVKSFLEELATRAWRRPLEASELDALVALAQGVGGDLGDPIAGLKFGLAGVLQSPNFLFRIDIGEPDPDDPDLVRYTGWEMASRLSFLLTDAPPDAELREAAELGELTDVERVRSEAERLIDTPAARASMVRFFRDFMAIRNLDALKKNADRVPQFTATLGPAMRVELERMFESVVFEEEGDFRHLFTTQETYLNEELALLYGIDGITGPDFRPVTFPASAKRSGVLTSLGFLAMNAHETQTSPTHRGRFVRINLLCQDIPPPPPGVNTSLPEPDPDAPPKTFRAQLDQHREDPACAGCHERMDPIGFGFEHYDAIGAYRDQDENGLTVDSTTEVEGQAVADGVEMGKLIGGLPEVGACVARRFFEHAGGHLAGPGDDKSVATLVDDFVASDFDFKQLVVALVTNDGYRYATPVDAAADSEEP